MARRIDVPALRKRFKRISQPKLIVPAIDDVIGRVHQDIEHRLYSDESDLTANYFAQPRIVARAAIADLSGLKQAFTDVLGRTPQRLAVLETVEDLEKIGTLEDFAASLFWEEIESITTREADPGVAERFRLNVASLPTEQQKFYQAMFRHLGPEIHGIRAKDTTSRWAYYHVYVQDKNEHRFMDAIGGLGIIDLEEFGRVCASGYEHSFRQSRAEQAKKRFQRVIEKYETLAKRVRSYSFGLHGKSKADPEEKFRRQAFRNAVKDVGSREELTRLLAETRSLHSDDAPDFSAPLNSNWTHWASPKLADLVIRLAHVNSVTLNDIAGLAKFVTRVDKQITSGAARYLRSTVRWVGNTPSGFDAAINCIFTNPAIRSSSDLLDQIKVLRAYRDDPIAGSPVFAFNSLYHSVIALIFSSDPGNPFITFQKIFYDYAVDREDDFDEDGFFSYLADNLGSYVASLSIEKTDVWTKEVAASDMSRSFVLEKNLLEYALSNNEGSAVSKLIAFIFDSDIIDSIRAISVFGVRINQLDEIDRQITLEGILERSLTEAFEAVSLPEHERRPFIRTLARTLLGLEETAATVARQAVPERQTADAGHEVAMGTKSDSDAPPMPTTEELRAAGRLYSQARQTDPTLDIVEHLKSVWMTWIEAGILTRPELRHRDISAYNALAQWLHRGGNIEHALGHRIPTKSEVIDSHIATVADLPPKERPVGLKWVTDKRAKTAR